MPFDDPLLPRDDVSIIGAEDIYLGALNTARNAANLWPGSTVRSDEELRNIFGVAPNVTFNPSTLPGNYRIDATGPVRMDPFRADPGFGGGGDFEMAFGGGFGGRSFAPTSGGLTGGGLSNVPNLGQPVRMEPFTVPETRPATPPVGNLILLGYDPNAPFVGPVAGGAPASTGTPPTLLPPFTVNETRPPTGTPVRTTTETPDWFRNYISRIGATQGVVMPPVTVTPPPTPRPDENVIIPPPVRPTLPPVTPPVLVPPPTPVSPPTPPPSVPSSGTPGAAPGGGGSTAPATTTRSGTERDFARELGITLAGLQQYQPQLLGMYKDLYQSFMPQGLTAAETSGLAQMRADEEKLNRLRQGILSPEDIRTATQGAREAYGARGQAFAPGAIGAEILNREAIRQQREDQARAAYQQSMGNVLNVANLQTGNIFQPISSLLSGTFNPLGAYPADVYGTNVNAALAREIAERNKEAAIESARLSGAAQQSAARTSAGGSVGAAVLPSVIAALPSIFCWVAREVYGEHNPRWQIFRHWILTRAPHWFVRLYLRHGEKFAKWLKRNPWLKPMIRRWMDSRIESMRPNYALKEAF